MAKKQFRTKYDYIPISRQEKVVTTGYTLNTAKLSKLLNIAWMIGCFAVGYELFLRGAS